MTLTAALLRASYLRTLHRFVGPHLCWCVRNAANSNAYAQNSISAVYAENSMGDEQCAS